MLTTIDKVSDKFDITDFSDISNLAYLVGIPKRIVHKGYQFNIESVIVELETLKGNFTWFILPNNGYAERLISSGKVLFIEGIFQTYSRFNYESLVHHYVVPSTVNELEDGFKLDAKTEFYMDFTLYNRIILDGNVLDEFKKEYVSGKELYVNNFKFRYNDKFGRFRTVNCVMWEPAYLSAKFEHGNSLDIKYAESLIKIVASFVIKHRVGRKPTYSLLVQKLSILD